MRRGLDGVAALFDWMDVGADVLGHMQEEGGSSLRTDA